MEIVILIILIILLIAVIWQIFSHNSGADKSLDLIRHFDSMNNQIHQFSRTLNERLDRSQEELGQSVRHQQKENKELVEGIGNKVNDLLATNKQVANFAEQLRELQVILKNPKQRGIIGEYYLETTLGNILSPTMYKMQYSFSDGVIVDAAIFVQDKIIPVDSKFSLENYNRIVDSSDADEITRLGKTFKQDIKNRIDETSKYIKPELGTMEFAFMFLPHEGIYYDILVAEIGAIKIDTQDLIEYAFKKNVIIVSPTTFVAYLQTVLQGMRALQIEEQAKDIRKNIIQLGKHLSAYQEYHNKLGTTLNTVINHYDKSSKEYRKIDKDVLRITGEDMDLETIDMERPMIDE